MLNRLDASMDFYQTALALRAKRQQVLAANIANADTPNYQARDFDFKTALGRALKQPGRVDGPGGLALATTAPRHIHANAPHGSSDVIDLKYRIPAQASLDGNTVDMNVARVEFIQNALHYQADLQLLGNRIKGLKMAMQPAR